MKVVIADDDGNVRAAVGETLVAAGVQVLEATNGLEALLHVKHERPDAVVLELRMPRLGGVEALKRIRAFDAAIAVIILTVETDPKLFEEATARGAKAVLPKPLNIAALAAALGITAPAATAARVAAAPAAVPVAVPPAQDAGAVRVLSIDDDPDVREMLTDFMSSEGYRVSTAEDAASGVRSLVASPADVVLLDIDMPGLSGVDALPTIRAVAPNAVVIMVSGNPDESIAQRTLAYGAFDFVTKPVNLEYLAQSVQTALAMKALEG
jgi:DNA-binding NtrC family response regulator